MEVFRMLYGAVDIPFPIASLIIVMLLGVTFPPLLHHSQRS
jgi:hypothetical protein